MRALIFGGTGFVGRHVAEACLARGHELTLVSRGLSDPAAFPGATKILGERTDPAVLAQVAARSFDLVFDTSGYLPREVRGAVEAITESDAHYVFVSTISVYAAAGPAEAAPLVEPIDDDGELAIPRYGGLKVACERAAITLGERCLVTRPGRILGPFDTDPRMPWLLRRVAEGGEVLAAGAPDAPAQYVDARDFGAWMVASAERRLAGTFNAVCPPLSVRELFDAIRDVTVSDARFTWVPDDVLLAHDVKPYGEAPFWLPAAFHDRARVDASRAIAEGLVLRPLADTVRDTWRWLQTGWDAGAGARAQKRLDIRAGMSRERERALLEASRSDGAGSSLPHSSRSAASAHRFGS
jgi:2'-hydroxyisoflavone reductase